MRLIIAFSIAFSLLSCNQTSDKKDTNTIIEKTELESKTTELNERFEEVDILELNRTLRQADKNLSSREVMQLFYPYQVKSSEGNEKINIEEEKLDNGNTLVTLIHDNLMDDSVKGKKYVIELYKKEGNWVVLSLKKNWKCWEGRGHSNWDTEFCL